MMPYGDIFHVVDILEPTLYLKRAYARIGQLPNAARKVEILKRKQVLIF